MKKLLLLILIPLSVQAKTIKVAVIDTGFDFRGTWKYSKLAKPKLCKDGHYDFVYNNKNPIDSHGHGTHIAGIIAQTNESVDYCLIILKFYNASRFYSNNLNNLIKAYGKAIELRVDVINISGGGTEYSIEECKIIKKALDAKIKVIAAAGNEYRELTKQKYYPAMCDDRVIKVLNVDYSGKLTSSSNRDSTRKIPNVVRALGENIISFTLYNSLGSLSGTSQATAAVTRDFIHNAK